MTARPPEGPAPDGAGPSVRLERWRGSWPDDDPFAAFKAEVVDHGRLDPLETLRGLSDVSGIPVGALARYVLAKWACGGSEAILELGVSGVDHLARTIGTAEAAGTDEARLAAYDEVRSQIDWLRAGVRQHTGTDPAEPSGPG